MALPRAARPRRSARADPRRAGREASIGRPAMSVRPDRAMQAVARRAASMDRSSSLEAQGTTRRDMARRGMTRRGASTDRSSSLEARNMARRHSRGGWPGRQACALPVGGWFCRRNRSARPSRPGGIAVPLVEAGRDHGRRPVQRGVETRPLALVQDRHEVDGETGSGGGDGRRQGLTHRGQAAGAKDSGADAAEDCEPQGNKRCHEAPSQDPQHGPL